MPDLDLSAFPLKDKGEIEYARFGLIRDIIAVY